MNYFLSLVIVLAPVFSNYVLFGPISIGDFFVFFATIFLAKHFKINALNIVSIAVAFVVIFIGFYVLYDEGLGLGFLRIAFYYFLFFFVVSLEKINFEKFLLVYIYCCMFFSASIFFQWAAYEFLNTNASLQLPIPYYEPDTLKVIDDLFRSGGWFKEPSYFAIFTLPAFFYLLSQRSYLKYFLLAVAGIVSTSSLAIFGILISIFFFFVKAERERLLLTCLMPVFVVIAFGILHFFGELTFVSRVVDIFVDGGTLNERGLPVLDIIQLTSNVTPNPMAHNLVISGGHSGFVWYSSAAYILASLGWLGFLIISLNFLRLGLFAAIMFFALTLTTHMFSGSYSFLIALAFMSFGVNLRRLS